MGDVTSEHVFLESIKRRLNLGQQISKQKSSMVSVSGPASRFLSSVSALPPYDNRA